MHIIHIDVDLLKTNVKVYRAVWAWYSEFFSAAFWWAVTDRNPVLSPSSLHWPSMCTRSDYFWSCWWIADSKTTYRALWQSTAGNCEWLAHQKEKASPVKWIFTVYRWRTAAIKPATATLRYLSRSACKERFLKRTHLTYLPATLDAVWNPLFRTLLLIPTANAAR